MNIGVIFGGNSTEHDVSVLTALFVTNAVRGKTVWPICIEAAGAWKTGKFFRVADLAAMKPCALLPGGELVRLGKLGPKKLARLDCVVNCCHGGAGENGDLAGLLATLGVPVTSSDPYASRISMNKILTKTALPEGVRRADWAALRPDGSAREEALAFGLPAVVKPASGGSSIGISVCRTEEELDRALALAFTLDDEVLCERFVPEFKEVNCAAYRRGEEIVLSRLESPGRRADILSFDEKYMNFSKQSGDREFPAVLPAAAEAEILATTERVYRAWGMRGIVRMDYLVTAEGVFFNEANSVPGSLAFYLFERDFGQVLDEVVEEALAERERKAKLVTSFHSQLLNAGSRGLKNVCKK